MQFLGTSRRELHKVISSSPLLTICLLLTACSHPAPDQQQKQSETHAVSEQQKSGTFTLETGVTVTEQTACDPSTESSLSIQEKSKGTYEIKVKDLFDCDEERLEPYLTES